MAWVWRQGRELNYLTIPEWGELGVEVAFSTRRGGVSQSPYASLNLGLHVDDRAEDVRENRKRWFGEWNAGSEEIVIGEQVHGTGIHRARPEDGGRGSLDSESAVPGIDALITTTPIALMAFFADCVPVFIYDPRLRAVALAHAGWKGTAGKITAKVIDDLQSLGGDPEGCLAAIGPSIGPCCYEVDQRVSAAFQEPVFGQKIFNPTNPGHGALNLWEANRNLLLHSGIRAENIVMANICTSCHGDTFFSHRREGPKTGRMAGWLRLRQLRGG